MTTTTQHPVDIRQIAGYRLKQCREARGWTQSQFCEELERQTGIRWSVTTLSATESSWGAKNPKNRAFDLIDVVALTHVLGVTLPEFLEPPEHDPQGNPIDGTQKWITVSEGLTLSTPDLLARLASPAQGPVGHSTNIAGTTSPTALSGWLTRSLADPAIKSTLWQDHPSDSEALLMLIHRLVQEWTERTGSGPKTRPQSDSGRR